ncbi:hypothetical protein [Streptomyces pseudovenezuelae]|uniref:hypothetical protein n=1 Tax=Streptomyces pseudovenezuelae TaxID=67350 RepID=UPI002E806A30|nr:hypothetical protein [Streptomyces pseudovenezuelae]WUA94460.1 hypothetical protein OHO81_45285 [Streptomyces pseudovenezuelae]
MNYLPDPQPTAPQAGQPLHHDTAHRRAAQIAAAVDAIYTSQPTAVRVTDPTIPSYKDGPRIGTAPAIPQPGIPPQSRAAVDYAVRVLSTAVATAITSGSLALLLYASKYANPLVCGIVFGAPIGLAVPIAALASLAKRTKEVVAAAPPVIHQHYSGHITQTNQTINADSHGLVAVTRPQLPPAH